MKKKYIKISFQSLSSRVLKLYSVFLKKVFNRYSLDFKFICLPTKKKRITLLKSPHVYKKAKSQFEVCSYKILVVLLNLDSMQLIKLLTINRPKTIKIKYTL
jgi:ribosomal protein S10